MKLRNPDRSRLGWSVAALLYGALFLLILWLAYTGNLPPQLAQIPFYDTIGHFVLYSLATYLGHRVLQQRRIHILAYHLPLWPLVFGLFTLTEEGLQSLSPNRTLSLVDLVASLIGVLFGYWLAERGRDRI